MLSDLPVYTLSNNCQDCYKCIRECPVKAIRMDQNRAGIIAELCVSCGHCTAVCPAGAKKYRNDTGIVQNWLDDGSDVVLSLAPSYVVLHGGNRENIARRIKNSGFSRVSETALGAEIVNRKTEDWLKKECPNLAISSACPAVVNLINQYYPELSESVVPVASPMLVHARMLRQLIGKQAKIVFAGPCIAKKYEADNSEGLIDAAITFDELKDILDETPFHDTVAKRDSWFPFPASDCRIYPMEGGMIRGLSGVPVEYHTMAFSGMENCKAILSDLRDNAPETPLFLELMACQGGCLMGPGVTTKGSVAIRQLKIPNELANGKHDKSWPIAIPDQFPPARMTRRAYFTCVYSEDEMRSALESVGKHSAADELNCSGCGYDSCRELARAMLDGKAERTQCVSYMRRVANDKASVLIEKIPFGVVMVDDQLRIVDANKQFAELIGGDLPMMFEATNSLYGADLKKILPFYKLFSSVLDSGEEKVEHDIRVGEKFFRVSVITIRKYKLVTGMIENLRDERTRQQVAVDRLQDVISKNMKVVQEIAYLLGENAAYTESMLHSVIDSHEDES